MANGQLSATVLLIPTLNKLIKLLKKKIMGSYTVVVPILVSRSGLDLAAESTFNHAPFSFLILAIIFVLACPRNYQFNINLNGQPNTKIQKRIK